MSAGERVVRVILSGSSEGAVRAFEETAAASEQASGKVEQGWGGGKLKGLLENPFAAATVAAAATAVAVGATVSAMASEYATATDEMAAKANITIGQANQIGNAFLGTAFQSTFSAKELMEAYGPVSGLLGQVQGSALTAAQSLQVMKAASDLAESSGADLTTSTGVLAQTLQTFHLKVGDAAMASDTLFRTSAALGVPIDVLQQQMTKLHSKTGDAGGSLQQMSALLVDMKQHGLDGKTALSTLSTAEASLLAVQQKVAPQYESARASYINAQVALDRLTKSHKASAAQIEGAKTTLAAAKDRMDALSTSAVGLGIKVYDSKGQFVGMQSVIDQMRTKMKGMTDQQREAAENAVFGAGAFQKLDSTIMAGQGGIDKATAAVTRGTTAHEAAEKATDNLSGAWKRAKAGVEDLGIRLGQLLLPVETAVVNAIVSGVIPAINGAITAFTDVVGWVGKAVGVVKSLAVPIGVLTAAIVLQNASLILNKLALAGSYAVCAIWQGVTEAATGAQWLWNAAMDANPIGLVTLAIAALIGIGVLLVTHLKQVGQFFGTVWKGATAAVSTAWTAISGAVGAGLKVVEKVIGVAFGVITAPVRLYVTAWGDAIGSVVAIVKGGVGIVVGVWDGATRMIGGFIGALGRGFGAVFTGMGSVVSKALGGVIGIAKGIIDVPIKIINGVISAIDGINIKVPSWVPGLGGKGWGGLGISKLPLLDTGGVTYGPTVALLSANRVPEIAAPQPLLMSVFNQVLDQRGVGGSGGAGGDTHNYYIQGADPNAVVNALRTYQRRNGSVPITADRAKAVA